jgi:hypothetical protein
VWDKFKSNFPGSQFVKRLGLDSDLGDAFPAPHSVLPAQPATQWHNACEAYRHDLKTQKIQKMQLQPAGSLNFGAVHAAVAQTFWERRGEFTQQYAKRVMCVESAAGLQAVFSPSQRLVQVRISGAAQIPKSTAVELHGRIMPSTAKLLEGEAARDFQTLPLALLLWHFGQTALQALEMMPSLDSIALHLQRFPGLEPQTLLLRHLRLIHALSREDLNFEALLPLLDAADRPFVCPDLTSLYLTGALALKRRK